MLDETKARMKAAVEENIRKCGFHIYPVQGDASPRSYVVTNIAMLQGRRATEAFRWEEDGWQVFAGYGPEVERSDVRVISVGIALGIDSSLTPILGLGIDEGLVRDERTGAWEPWSKELAVELGVGPSVESAPPSDEPSS